MSPRTLPFLFGPWKINPTEIFFKSKLSLALVNFKPVITGHVLIIPERVVPRYTDLVSSIHITPRPPRKLLISILLPTSWLK